MPGLTHIDGDKYILYGYSGYKTDVFMAMKYQVLPLSHSQRFFNEAMAKSRIIVEWFLRMSRLTGLSWTSKKSGQRGIHWHAYIAGFSLINMRNVLYPNTISQYFRVVHHQLKFIFNIKAHEVPYPAAIAANSCQHVLRAY